MLTLSAHSHIHHDHRPRHWMNPVRWISKAIATHHQRMRLEDLDPRLLDDIGVDLYTAQREARRPFWDLPR